MQYDNRKEGLFKVKVIGEDSETMVVEEVETKLVVVEVVETTEVVIEEVESEGVSGGGGQC